MKILFKFFKSTPAIKRGFFITFVKITKMIDITIDSNIEKDDIIYNPNENVKYEVISYGYNVYFQSKIAYLRPFVPFGGNQREFSITIQDMIDLKYQFEKERRV